MGLAVCGMTSKLHEVIQPVAQGSHSEQPNQQDSHGHSSPQRECFWPDT